MDIMKKLILLLLGILVCILFITGCSQKIEKSLEVKAGTFLPYSINLYKGEIVHINIESNENMNFYLMDLENYNLLKEDDKNYDIFVGANCSQFKVRKLDCNFKAYEDGKYYVVLINYEDTLVNGNIKIEKLGGENLIMPPKKTQEMIGSTQFIRVEEALKELKVHVTIIKNDMNNLLEISNKYKDLTTASASANFVAEMTPRLNIYRAHLIEYKNFINDKNYPFPISTEELLKIEDRIVEIEAYTNKINTQKELYNQQLEEILALMKLMDEKI